MREITNFYEISWLISLSKRFMFCCTLGCPKMTQLLKCQAPWAFSGAKILVILKTGHKIEID